MQHPRRIVLQLHPNPVRLLHHVAVGDDVALGIHNHARAQGTLADRAGPATRTALAALSALAAEKAVKEVVKGIGIIIAIGSAAAPAGRLDGGFGVDVDHAGLKLLGDLRELVRELLRRRHGQLASHRRKMIFLSWPLTSGGDHGPDQDTHGQRKQDRNACTRDGSPSNVPKERLRADS